MAGGARRKGDHLQRDGAVEVEQQQAGLSGWLTSESIADQARQVGYGPLCVGAGQREYALIVRDRHIATLTTATDRATRRPLVVWVREDRDVEENAWLLVACAMEAAYFGTLVARMRHHQSNW